MVSQMSHAMLRDVLHTFVPGGSTKVRENLPYERSRTTKLPSSRVAAAEVSPEIVRRSFWTSRQISSGFTPGSSTLAATVFASAFSCKSSLCRERCQQKTYRAQRKQTYLGLKVSSAREVGSRVPTSVQEVRGRENRVFKASSKRLSNSVKGS